MPLRRPMLLCVLMIAPCVQAAELPRLTPLAPLRLDLSSAGTTIVAPASAEYRSIAQRLRDQLAAITHRPPQLASDAAAPESLGAGPILVLGNLMDSRLARRLYFAAYDFTDYAWPSAGGFVVRTIRDPLGTGAHVIMLGGSDAAGAGQAALALVATVKEQGPVLGYVNRVRLGRCADLIEKYTRNLLSDDPQTWLRSGYSGSWDYQIQIAHAALGYLRTGNEAYLPAFHRELRWWFDHDVYHPKSDAPQMLHGFLHTILIPWDLVRDHPAFSEAQRRQIDADFLWVFSSAEGPGRIAADRRKRQIRNNHGTRTALDGFYGGRYFQRRYGLPEARAWLDVADRYFAPQMECAKPNEDSWGHQWAASMYNTLDYYLAAGKEDYLRSEGFKRAADRALIAHPNACTPLGYMSACAAATGDSGYLSGWSERSRIPLAAAMSGMGDEAMRSFCTAEPLRPRNAMIGLAEAPLDRLWAETVDGGPKPGSLFVNTLEGNPGFDKIALREAWDPRAYYLLLDGISGGGHSYQDANCIVRYDEQGIHWFSDTYRASQSATVRQQNGVFWAIDGTGPGRLHRFAKKLYAGSAGDYTAVGSALTGLGDVDWQRHILRRRASWTVVIDRAVVKRPGEILAERHWHVGGRVEPRPDGLLSRVSSRTLHLQSAGVAPEGMRGTSDRAEIVRARATPDTPLEMATLLYVSIKPAATEPRLLRGATGWRVETAGGSDAILVGHKGAGMAIEGPTGRAVIGVADADQSSRPGQPAAEPLPLRPKCPAIALGWRELRVGQKPVTAIARADDGRLAAGDASGQVVRYGAHAARQAVAKMPSSILALHFLGDDLLVGEERGAITRLAPDGSQRWQREIPYVPMAWANWSEERSRIREIDAADLDGDGQAEILLANSDRRLYALSGAGTELWKASVQWGILTAMCVGKYHGQPVVLGGTSRPSIFGHCLLFGAGGKVLATLARPDLQSWSNPSQFRDQRLADLDGDGRPEIINAIDTDCRQLVVYKEDGKVLWDADLAGPAEAVAVAPANGSLAPTVYCTSASGYVCALDGKTGARRWACYVGEPTHFVAPADRGAIAAAPSGRVFVIRGDGVLAGSSDVGSPITGLLRPGDHRQANAVLLGTADGRLLVLP